MKLKSYKMKVNKGLLFKKEEQWLVLYKDIELPLYQDYFYVHNEERTELKNKKVKFELFKFKNVSYARITR